MQLFHKNHPTSSSSRSRIFRLPEIGADAYKDWTLILIASGAAALCLGIFGVASYADVSRELSQPSTAVASAPKQVIDTHSLSQAIGGFSARAGEYASLLKGYSGPGDPSF